MNTLTVFVPVCAAAALAMVVTACHRRLPPILAARITAVTLIVVVGTALPTLWIVSLGYLTHVPFLGIGLEWCAEAFGVHEGIPAWLGVAATLLTTVGAYRVAIVVRSYRRLRQDHGALDIADDERAFAYTLPGPGGHVVVSSGLVDLLDDDEYTVVLAHEAAHGRHRHDRYLVIARIAAASIPPLKQLADRLEFSLERWADEAAAREHGSREFVARTLGKVALFGVEPVGAMNFVGLGVPARVEALLRPPVPAPTGLLVGTILSGIVVTGLLASLQIHHLATFITALCPG